jgi:hypothetical protein
MNPDFKLGVSQPSKHIQILGSCLFNPARLLGQISSPSRAGKVFISSRPLGSKARGHGMRAPGAGRSCCRVVRLASDVGMRAGFPAESFMDSFWNADRNDFGILLARSWGAG